MSTPDDLYRSLMNFQITDSLSMEEIESNIGQLIDIAFDLGREEGVHRGIKLAEQCLDQQPQAAEKAILHYFLANAWYYLGTISRSGTDALWDWEQPEREKELLHLRRSFMDDGFSTLPAIRQCQIATNMGNLLSHVGRFADAIEYWNRALKVVPDFGMALANRGHGLIYYAQSLYDAGHRDVFLRQAWIDLSAGLSLDVDDCARTLFEQDKSFIESYLSTKYLANGINMDNFSLGDTNEEQQYRRWCLDNRLFLNPLNDLEPYSIAARDVFFTPSIVAHCHEGPHYQGFFNQMKQEFVSARYLYYEGITATQPHFSDRDVFLVNTLDYPTYSLAVEKIRVAFRMAYSLLDKIAYFLNDYLQLGIPERAVTFRTIWYDNQKRKKGLKCRFQQYKNWPLRGLFWLSKDLYEPNFQEAIEPDAQVLSDIRNHAEHKYLKLHDILITNIPEGHKPEMGDRLAYSIKRDDFQKKALRILKHARAGLIYLSLGVHCEEQERQSSKEKGKITMPIFLDTWQDEWKI